MESTCIRLLRAEIDEFYRNFRVSNDLIELRNLVQSADLIIRSAQLRQESRGLHFSRDYPDTLPVAGNTVLNPRPGTMCPSVCGVSSERHPEPTQVIGGRAVSSAKLRTRLSVAVR
jgi:L-aspartate oxidase